MSLLPQSTIFSVLSHLLSLTNSFRISTLSLPLIWDNILLSMWSISGSYVGFGWKDAEQLLVGEGDEQRLRIQQANRKEEMDVYNCMCKYIEANLRNIKQCLSNLP